MTEQPQRSERPIELLTVSRLQSSKRIDWILRALAGIQKQAGTYPAWRLHVAGSGPDAAALKALCTQLGLDAQVVFHGFVSDEELRALYARSHVFLMPAKQGYGLPAIEALYQKMGLVVSDESGVVEILDNTNWVAIARGGEAGFGKALGEMLLRVGQAGFFDQALPALPMEKTWAEELIQHLQW
jgi:glycosyltransferase involved in cell wall biosynthesis